MTGYFSIITRSPTTKVSSD